MRVLLKLHPYFVTKEFLEEEILPTLKEFGVDYEILPENVRAVENYPEGDFVLVIGGDGTFLAGSVVAASLDIPVIGLQLGHLGFLCHLPLDSLPEVLSALKKGNFDIEERPVLSCTLTKKEKGLKNFISINEVVVGKTELSSLVQINCFLDENPLGTFKADGVIIASATGSTAYSLSAGGSLVEPHLRVLLVTPICAHTLYAKPLVIDGKHKVKVNIIAQRAEVGVAVDGHIVSSLEPGEEVVASLRDEPLKVANIESPSFIEILRERFGWGFDFQKNKPD